MCIIQMFGKQYGVCQVTFVMLAICEGSPLSTYSLNVSWSTVYGRLWMEL